MTVGICRISIAVLGTILSFGVHHSVDAQSARQSLERGFYTDAVDAIWPGSGMLAGLSDLDYQVLGRSLYERANLFAALSVVQSEIGLGYYTRRDTSKGFSQTPYDNFFRGRYAFETGDFAAAAVLFSKAAASSSLNTVWRNRARVWMEAARSRQSGEAARPASLRQFEEQTDGSADDAAYVLWRYWDVEPSDDAPSESNDTAGLRARLWRLTLTDDFAEIKRVRDQLANAEQADVVYTIDSELRLNLYDPSTLYVLALADWVLADAVLQQVRNNDTAQLLAGIAAYNARRYGDAARILKGLKSSRAALYRQLAISELSGGGAKGELDKLRKSDVSVDVEWAALKGTPAEVAAVHRRWQGARSDDSETTVQMAMALTHVGEAGTALDILEKHFPAHRRRPDRLYPLLDAVETYSMFMVGRRYYPVVLDRLAQLALAYKPVVPVHDMAQGLAAPDRDDGGKQVRTGL